MSRRTAGEEGATGIDSAGVHGEFRSDEFDRGFIGRVGYAIFHWRRPLLVFSILLTLALGWSATHLQITAGFTKMIPLNHPFMKTFVQYLGDFGGADRVLIAVKVKQGDIYAKDVIETVRKITDEAFYSKGVERSSLTSLVTPNARWSEVVEDGFRGGPIVAADFAGTPDQLEQVRRNVQRSSLVGRVVASDATATMVAFTLMERDPESGARLDLRAIGAKLEAIRAKYEGERVSVHIIGFAKASADIAAGASSVLLFFIAAFVVTAVLLLWYTGSVMLTAWVLVAAAVPVVWLLGILPRVGMGLDPLSILVPFLIFAIGVSHAVQMTNAWKLETLAGADGVTASRNCFIKLFSPGATALLANAVGFAVIALVQIEIVRELALTATIGVTVMIITNKVVLPILLSYMRLSAAAAQRLRGKETAGDSIWERFGVLATRRGAVLPLLAGVALAVFSGWQARHLEIGDLGRGVPELREDSRYNRDVEMITGSFAIGVDVLQVIAEIKGDDSPCLNREAMDKVEDFDFTMRQVDGVSAVSSMPAFIQAVTQDFAEGWLKWRMLPETKQQIAQGVGFSSRFATEFRNIACSALPVSIYTSDHQATTINRVVAAVEGFKAENDSDLITFRLASGNVGVMAATNDVVKTSDKWVNVALFVAVAALCMVTFRSWRITFCIIVPLALATLLCNAIMAMLGIGVKVSTLPVIAISVGVGVDYGIYLFERIRHDMDVRGLRLDQAFVAALKQRGTASLFTAVTMTLSVVTWVFSDLKFQADMGILLAAMFLVCLFGAIFLMPALAAFVLKRTPPAP